MRGLVLWLFTILYFNSLLSQITDSNPGSTEDQTGKIKATVRVDKNEVPQNRTIIYTIEISWQGDLDRYEIEKFENPILTNLEIVGNSSSNWVGEIGGVNYAIKTYEYVLKPLSLGMAYIDGVIIEYKDKESDKTQRLITNRLEVQVLDPIPESNSTKWVLAGGVFLSLILISTGGFFILKRKKQKEVEERQKSIDIIPIEEKYLSDIKENVNLQTHNNVESFSTLSKIFRRYLSERYQIPSLEITTQEILDALKKMAISERIIQEAEEILKTCDVAKFSGGHLEQGGLERIYTLVEDILDRNKSEYIEFTNQ